MSCLNTIRISFNISTSGPRSSHIFYSLLHLSVVISFLHYILHLLFFLLDITNQYVCYLFEFVLIFFKVQSFLFFQGVCEYGKSF